MALGMIKQIEKNIKTKMHSIKVGSITPKESGVGIQFTKLKTLDEVSYETLLKEYKKILKKYFDN
jgi:hypothetical protein